MAGRGFQPVPADVRLTAEEEELSKILHMVGDGAQGGKRVEVPFDSIAPKPRSVVDAQSAGDLRFPSAAPGRRGCRPSAWAGAWPSMRWSPARPVRVNPRCCTR